MAIDPARYGHLIHGASSVAQERRAKAALREWLPGGLKWLVRHRRLLGWYLRLPHRTEVMAVQWKGSGVVRYEVRRRG